MKFVIALQAIYSGYIVVACLVIIFGLILLFYYFRLYRFIRPLGGVVGMDMFYRLRCSEGSMVAAVVVLLACIFLSCFYADFISLGTLMAFL